MSYDEITTTIANEKARTGKARVDFAKVYAALGKLGRRPVNAPGGIACGEDAAICIQAGLSVMAD
jgi:hypothetical protein